MLVFEKSAELKKLRDDLELERSLFSEVKQQPYPRFEDTFTKGKDVWEAIQCEYSFDFGFVFFLLDNLRYAYINRNEFQKAIKPALDKLEKDIKEKEEQVQRMQSELEQMYTDFFNKNADMFGFIFQQDMIKHLIINFLLS